MPTPDNIAIIMRYAFFLLSSTLCVATEATNPRARCVRLEKSSCVARVRVQYKHIHYYVQSARANATRVANWGTCGKYAANVSVCAVVEQHTSERYCSTMAYAFGIVMGIARVPHTHTHLYIFCMVTKRKRQMWVGRFRGLSSAASFWSELVFWCNCSTCAMFLSTYACCQKYVSHNFISFEYKS